MSHYRSNVRDLEFNLFEVLGAGERMGVGPFAEMDADTARGVLHELEKVASGPVAASFVDADRNPPVYDPATFSVTMPESFKKSYQAIMDGEWYRLELPTELGGYGASPSLRWAAAELMLGANPALFMYSGGPNFAAVVHKNGTPLQQQMAETMIEKQWGSTMVLTEPDAGSDVGAGRTKAILQPDGSWHLEGVKRFITSAEQDLTDNIVHLVLARPEGPGIESRPGTKGLSLFVVPKFLFDPETGELGERNGVFVTGVEHKMGLKVSTTCELSFGIHGTPAVGYLLGDKHDGIAQMFQVIEYARMMVGTKAIATLSTGYLNALEYAKQRVQSADLTRASDKTAPRVTIIHHPDVRRILMKQKAYAEGLRAVYLYTAGWQDRIAGGELSADEWSSRQAGQRPAAADRQGRRLGAGVREPGAVAAGVRRVRLHPGLPDRAVHPGRQDRHPVRGHHRDPGAGLLLPQDRQGRRRRAGHRGRRDRRFITVLAVGEHRRPEQGGARLCWAPRWPTCRRWSARWSATRWPRSQEPESVYKVGEHAVSLLMSVGDLMIGYLLLRQATVAQAALDAGASREGHRLLRRQAGRGALVRPERAARADRPAGDHRERRPVADGGRGVRLLSPTVAA